VLASFALLLGLTSCGEPAEPPPAPVLSPFVFKGTVGQDALNYQDGVDSIVRLNITGQARSGTVYAYGKKEVFRYTRTPEIGWYFDDVKAPGVAYTTASEFFRLFRQGTQTLSPAEGEPGAYFIYYDVNGVPYSTFGVTQPIDARFNVQQVLDTVPRHPLTFHAAVWMNLTFQNIRVKNPAGDSLLLRTGSALVGMHSTVVPQ